MLLGGKERFENLPEVIGRDAGAGVFHHQGGIVHLRHDHAAHGTHIRRGNPTRRQRNPTAANLTLGEDGIAGIDHQVDDHLLQLAGVSPHRTQITIMGDGKLHLLPNQALEQGRNVLHHVRQLQNFWPQSLLTAEGQQLPRQAGCAVGIGANLLDIVIVAVTRGMAQQHQIAGTQDRGQHIVEIVRHPASQLAHGLHLGRLGDLALEPGFLGAVGNAQQDGSLTQPAHPCEAKRDRVFRLGAKPDCKIARRRWALGEAADCIRNRALVFLHHQIGRIGWRHLTLTPGSAHEGRIGKQQPPVAIGHGQPQRQVAQQGFKVRHGGCTLNRAATNADACFNQQHQRGCVGIVHRPGRIGIAHREVVHRQRVAAPPLARPTDLVALFLAEE